MHIIESYYDNIAKVELCDVACGDLVICVWLVTEEGLIDSGIVAHNGEVLCLHCFCAKRRRDGICGL